MTLLNRRVGGGGAKKKKNRSLTKWEQLKAKAKARRGPHPHAKSKYRTKTSALPYNSGTPHPGSLMDPNAYIQQIRNTPNALNTGGFVTKEDLKAFGQQFSRHIIDNQTKVMKQNETQNARAGPSSKVEKYRQDYNAYRDMHGQKAADEWDKLNQEIDMEELTQKMNKLKGVGQAPQSNNNNHQGQEAPTNNNMQVINPREETPAAHMPGTAAYDQNVEELAAESRRSQNPPTGMQQGQPGNPADYTGTLENEERISQMDTSQDLTVPNPAANPEVPSSLVPISTEQGQATTTPTGEQITPVPEVHSRNPMPPTGPVHQQFHPQQLGGTTRGIRGHLGYDRIPPRPTRGPLAQAKWDQTHGLQNQTPPSPASNALVPAESGRVTFAPPVVAEEQSPASNALVPGARVSFAPPVVAEELTTPETQLALTDTKRQHEPVSLRPGETEQAGGASGGREKVQARPPVNRKRERESNPNAVGQADPESRARNEFSGTRFL